MDWTNVINTSFQAVWNDMVLALPNIFGAIIIFIVGWFIAVALGSVVAQLTNALKINQALAKFGLEKPLSKTGLRLDAGKFIGELVKWFLIIGFLLVAANILGLDQVSIFLIDILNYIPQIIIAVVILLVAVVFANFMQKLITSSIAAADLASAKFLGVFTKWVILVFAFLIALRHLQIAPDLIKTLYVGIVSMFAIAGGIAFGLGGKEHADHLIKLFKKEVSEHKEHHEHK